MESLARQLPAVQQLPPTAVAELIRQHISAGHRCYGFLLEHPAVSSFSAALLEELLLELVQQSKQCFPGDVCLAHHVALLKAPAAAQLPAQTVATLLQHAVHEVMFDDRHALRSTFAEVQQQLLALPAVQQLSADAMAEILAAAARQGNAAAVRSLCQQSAAQKLSEEAAAALHLLALQHGHFRVVQQLQELPQLQGSKQPQLQPTSEQLHQMLSVAIDSGNSEAVVLLCQLAASQAAARLLPHFMQQLLSQALHRWMHWDRNITDAAAEQLFSMQDAHAVEAAAAAELLHECISKHSAAGMLQLVALLPAAEQVSQQDAENLMISAIQQQQESRSQLAQELLQALLQFPAVQRLQPNAVERGLMAGYKQQLPLQQLQQIHKQLLNANSNNVAHVALRQLLLLSFEQQRWDVFDWLKELPIVTCCAAGAVTDVDLCCELRALQLQASSDR
jgi:hypothetical protein